MTGQSQQVVTPIRAKDEIAAALALSTAGLSTACLGTDQAQGYFVSGCLINTAGKRTFGDASLNAPFGGTFSGH